MFFKIQNKQLPCDLHGIISSDGLVFFKATDVAKIIKKKKPGQFALENGYLQIKDVVPQKINLKPSIAKLWIFGYNHTVDILSKCKSNTPAHLLGKELRSESAVVIRYPEEEIAFSDPKIACRVKIFFNRCEDYAEELRKFIGYENRTTRNGSEPDHLELFFKDFKLKCFEFYDRLAKKAAEEEQQQQQPKIKVEKMEMDNESMEQTTVRMHMYKKDLDYYQMSEAPKYVNIYFGDKLFQYQMI